MSDWLDHPAVQAAIAPFVVALVVALLGGRSRLAWLAIVAGYATMVALTTGIAFTPLSASRKIVLLCFVAPLAGLVADRWLARKRGGAANSRGRGTVVALALAAGAAAVWVFAGVLAQKEGVQAWTAGLLLAAFAAAMVASVATLREDPLRAGAAGVGLGVGVGVAAVVSASIGFLFAGAAVAAAAAAVLVAPVVGARPATPGLTGPLSIGVAIALFAEGAAMLAQLPWYAAAALLLVPLAVRLPVRESASAAVRAALHTLVALAAAAVPIAAAYVAARSSTS